MRVALGVLLVVAACGGAAQPGPSDAKALAAKGEQIRALPVEGGLRAATIEPRGPTTADAPVFVLGVVCAHGDGTLQQIEFYVLPEMVDDFAEYAARARAVARELRPGQRRIEARGGAVRLRDRIALDLPPGFLVSTQRGPDFDVHRIRKLARVGQPSGLLGVYVGGHPSFQHTQRDGGNVPAVQRESGTLVGKETTWIAWTSDDGARFREAIVRLDDHLALHAYSLAGSEAVERKLMSIAASLRNTSP